MAPNLRILLRYAIMYIAASGWLNEQLRDMIGGNPELVDALTFVISGGIIAGIEWVTWYARQRGWRT